MPNSEMDLIPVMPRPAAAPASVSAPRDAQVRTVVQALRIIYGSIQAHSHWVEQQCGVSSVQLWALREIQNAPGIKVTELALVLSIHPSNCSSMVDKLRKKGFVRKQRIGPDQRVVRLHTTPKGAELLGTAPLPAHGPLLDALENLSDQSLKTLEAGLAELVNGIKNKSTITALRPIGAP